MPCCAGYRAGMAKVFCRGWTTNGFLTPDWLWPALDGEYGKDTARAIAGAHLKEAPLDIVVKDLLRIRKAKRCLAQVRRLSCQGRIEDLPGFTEGNCWVQDAAATLPTRLLGEGAGERVLDLCAAPGGKTTQLAAPAPR